MCKPKNVKRRNKYIKLSNDDQSEDYAEDFWGDEYSDQEIYLF